MKTKQLFQSLILTAGIMSAGFLHAQNSCQAGFTYSVNNNVVTFTNTSTGGSQPGYYWNFGDGNTNWQTNPVHTYMYNGTYNVCLYMWDSLQACQSSFCDSVVITNAPPQPCNANYSYYISGSTSYFTDQSTGGPFIAWNWNFGDGNSSSLQNPSHSYVNGGTYTVCLTVYSQTDTCNYCSTVTYYPCNLQASFTYNNASDPTVSFTNTSTGAGAPYYYWSFGDGNSSYGITNPSHTYQYNGTFLVCLTVGDSVNVNCSDTYCDTIIITNAVNPPCNASFQSYDSSGTVYFWAASQNNISYFWNFGDSTTGTGNWVTHTYAQTGWYYVCLTLVTPNGDTCTGCDSIYANKMLNVDELTGNIAEINAFPNPFSGTATIFYSVKEKEEVNISVYSDMGLKVAEIENGSRESGNHQLQWNAENLNPGVYFLEIKSGGGIFSRKMILIK